jgi:3-oxoacyl-(acyl-carrier-protein) synthase
VAARIAAGRPAPAGHPDRSFNANTAFEFDTVGSPAMALGMTEPTFAIASACASATHAIGQSFHMIRGDAVTCALSGGTEACIAPGMERGWEALRCRACIRRSAS